MKYKNPQMEVIYLDDEDIVRTSDLPLVPGGGNEDSGDPNTVSDLSI